MKYKLDHTLMKDVRNRYRTTSLILEHAKSEEFVLFTLDDNDVVRGGKTYFSLRKLFLEASDPTEYAFANTVFGAWHTWQMFVNNKMYDKHISRWRDELEVKLKSEAILQIKKNAKEGIKGQSAAKYLADGGWDTSKSKKAHKEKINQDIHDELSEIEESIGITH